LALAYAVLSFLGM